MKTEQNKRMKFLQKLVDELKKENETLVLSENDLKLELEREQNKPKDGYNKAMKLLSSIEMKQKTFQKTLSIIEKELGVYEKHSEKLRKKIARLNKRDEK